LKNNKDTAKTKSAMIKLLDLIQRIPGKKILTLTTAEDYFKIDVDAESKYGYAEGHFFLFKAKLATALNEGGGLIIRQFLDIKFEQRVPNGKLMWIPVKKIYGVMLGNNTWQALSEQEVRESYCTDNQTGKTIESEPGIVFSSCPC
jgi:hypothetical protein